MIHFLAGTFPCTDAENISAFRTFIDINTPFKLESMSAVPIVQQMKVRMPGQSGFLTCFMFWCSTDQVSFKQYFDLDFAIGHSLPIQKKISDRFATWANEFIQVRSNGG